MLGINTETVIEKLNGKVRILEKRCEFFSSILKLSEIINSTLILDDLLAISMELSKEVMDAEASSLMLVDEETNELVFQLAFSEVSETLKKEIRLKIGEGIAGWVAEHGESVLIDDVQNDKRFYSNADKKTGFVTKSMICCPLKVRGKVVGITQVINKKDGSLFSTEDKNIFEIFSNQIAVAVENAKMHEKIVSNYKLEQELEFARTIQKSFLPKAFSDGQKHNLSAFNIPARNVSGDFYDFFTIDDESIGFMVGDVSGKGVPAALYMANMISKFRCMGRDFKDISTLFTQVNNSLCSTSNRGMFITLIFIKLNYKTGKVMHYNAGHLPLFIYRKNKNIVEEYNESSSIPLGILKDAEYKCENIQLEEDDILFACTDGITEAKSVNGEEFSTQRLKNSIIRSGDSETKIINELYEKIKDFTNNMVQHDDITMVALKWPGKYN